jgi:hypothetical protein
MAITGRGGSYLPGNAKNSPLPTPIKDRMDKAPGRNSEVIYSFTE